MTLQEIIKEYKNNTGVSFEYIAKKVGVTKSTVSRWASGEIKKVKEETLNNLSELLGKDVKTLISENIYRKPIFGYVKAGYDMFAEQNILGYEEVSSAEMKTGDYYLKVKGDSMINSRICDGDLVFIKKCDDVNSGEIAVVLVENEVTIKKVIKKEGLLILESSNPNYENRYFSNDEVINMPVKIIGKVLHTKIIF